MLLAILLAWCAQLRTWDIQYTKLSSHYHQATPDTITRTESGTLVDVYRINDKLWWISFEYLFFHVGNSQTIYSSIHHIASDQLLSWKYLYVWEWGRKLTKITQQDLESTKCPLTWAVTFEAQYPNLASQLLWAQNLDIGLLEKKSILKSYTGCIYYDPEKREFPYFLRSKANPESILVAIIPEGIWWATDYSRVDTLQR